MLVRAGALVRGLVGDGEWWRLISCIFVHVGFMHLLVNLIGVWLLGRLCEDLFGPWRTSAIFAIAGVAGSVASYLAVPSGISAGASGAIFGLVGAVFVELTLHRRRYRAAWNRGVWGSLAFVTIAQIGIDLVYPISDMWAHGAGLALGAVAGFVLSPHRRKVADYVARVVTVGFAGLAIVAAIMVARTSITDSFMQTPLVRLRGEYISAVVPGSWQVKGDLKEGDEIVDADVFITLLGYHAPMPLAGKLEAYTAAESGRARSFEFDQVAPAKDRLIPLPPGWQGSELVVSAADPLDNRQQYRVVVAGRDAEPGCILISLYLPESIARAAPDFFSRVIASVQ